MSLPEGHYTHEPRPIDGDQMAVAVSTDGNIGVTLPDGRPMWVIGPRTAEAMGEALLMGAQTADKVRERNHAQGN